MKTKSILMSIQPKWVAKILNGEKTIEVRKKFPKNYVGWVYIYCTKNGLPLMRCSNGKWFVKDKNYDYDMRFCYYAGYNGKVVARFWCDKVEDFNFCECSKYNDNVELYNECVKKDNELCKKACISCVQMVEYLYPKLTGKAIYISKLEVFDKLKELEEFYFQENCANCPHKKYCKASNICKHDLRKAPQSWCYVEGKND